MLSASLKRWAASPAFGAALHPMGVAGTSQFREIAAAFLARAGWAPDPSCVLFAGNGRQAIAAALSAVAKQGDRVGIEAVTYPVVKGIAARLGITLVPLPLDNEGLVPDIAAAAHRAKALAAVYLQPSLHSPLGVSMGHARKEKWASLLAKTGLIAIEDGIYSFLAPDNRPLAAFAPDRVIFVDSLSKRVSPGLTLGFLVAPPSLVSPLSASLRAGAWSAASFSVAIGAHWMKSGDAVAIMDRKRADAIARQGVARSILADSQLQADPRAFHAWLPLPEPWRGESFVAQALRRGIAITPGDAFAVGAGHAPSGARLALGAPDIDTLASALRALRSLISEDSERHVE